MNECLGNIEPGVMPIARIASCFEVIEHMYISRHFDKVNGYLEVVSRSATLVEEIQYLL